MSAGLLSLAAALAGGDTTAAELTEEVLARIERTRKLNAFITVDREGARRAAAESDARRKNGTPLSPYDGIPYAAKDNIETAGLRTTCASVMRKDSVPTHDAAVIQILRAKGFVLVGKTNLDEFAMGSSTTASAFGPTHNPYDVSRTCGGSSGGSAAAVAAETVPFALGSDTGGSVRQPAAFCGVVGTKPTYGRLSRQGMVEFAPSLDTVGIVTGNVTDAAILTGLLANPDARISAPVPVSPVRGLRIGIIDDLGNTPAVSAMLKTAGERLRAGGAEVSETAFPYRDTAAITYRVLAYSEGVSSLAGYGTGGAEKDAEIAALRGAGFGHEVKRRVLFGALMSQKEMREDYLEPARRMREKIRGTFGVLFGRYDLLLRATAPFGAFLLDRKLTAEEGCDMDFSTVCESLAGVPAMSVPLGRDEEGMPLGVQIAAPWLCEERMFAAGVFLETGDFPKPEFR